MVGISRRLTQRVVRRYYYPGEIVPTPKDIVKDVRRKVKLIRGFDLVDCAGGETLDGQGAHCFGYVLLFQRDGTTLEAQADMAKELADGREDVG